MKPVFKICCISSIVTYGIDCLIVTPYALLNYPVQEVGFILSRLYEAIGIWAFPSFFFYFALVMILSYKGLEKISSKLPEISQYLIAIIPTLFFVGLMVWTIHHNINVILLFH